jgi:hypothetical protein
MIPDIMARDSQVIPANVAPIQELVVGYPTRGRGVHRYRPGAYPRYAVRLMRAGATLATLGALAAETIASALLRRPERSSYWRRALLMQDLYADAFVRLYRNTTPRLATYHYHAVDTLSHWYWAQDGPGAGDGADARDHDVVPNAYRAADRILGRLLELTGPEATVLVVSDHGFRSNPDDRPRYRVRLAKLIRILGLEGRATPTRLAHQHFLYVADDVDLQGLAGALRESYVKATGVPVFPRVVVRDRSLFFPPPIVRLDGMTVVIPGYAELAAEELVDDTGQVETGVHDPDGMVVLAGPAIRPGAEISDAGILDAMPNMLSLLGLPLARDMGGRLWREAYRPEYERRFEPSYVDTYRRESSPSMLGTAVEPARDTEIIYQRLRDLGYL